MVVTDMPFGTYHVNEDESVSNALKLVSMRPAAVLVKDSIGHLSIGGQADVVVFDPQALWTVEAANLLSQGKHTPFSGFEMQGKVRATVVNGHLAYESIF